jgi:peptidoglycan lytic transglycosylase G
MSERTPEEREAARRERERRRAQKAGHPLPPEPEAAPPAADHEPQAPRRSRLLGGRAEPAAPEAAPPAADHEPQAPRRSRLLGGRAEPAAPPEAPPSAADPHATQLYDVAAEWTGETTAVAEQAPPAPAEREPERATEPATAAAPPAGPATEAHDVASGHDEPLGTRRVSALERMHLHGPRRSGRHGRDGGAGDPPPPPGSRRGRGAGGAPGGPRRLRGRVAAGAVILLAVVVGWFLISLFQPFAGDGGAPVVVRIPHGASASAIGDQLEREGVVSSAFFFGLRAQLAGKRGDLRSGTFTLRRDMSYAAAVTALTTAPKPPPVVRVTIPEGLSRREIAVIARKDGLRGDYLAASRRSKLLDPHRFGAPRSATLEGFLFPATYQLHVGSSVRALVAQQLAAIRQSLGSVDLRTARRKNLTPFDVLTIASMVEREVAVPKERRLVAAVIYNRLHDGMPLGIDATLRFALNDWTHPLTASQLANPTPYNTRTHKGMPPGPIGNPGLASIKAAARPAHVPYLFYVVKPGTCGEHAFSSTDAQFQRDVQRYNQARAAAGGKSPEKC